MQGPAEKLAAPSFPEIHSNRVEEFLMGEPVAELLQAIGQSAGVVVHPARNPTQAIGTVVDGVHRGHDGEKDLGRADIARRLVAPDVLLASLEREAIGRPTGGVV